MDDAVARERRSNQLEKAFNRHKLPRMLPESDQDVDLDGKRSEERGRKGNLALAVRGRSACEAEEVEGIAVS
eukprot:3674730-Rhodomonas_salina.2